MFKLKSVNYYKPALVNGCMHNLEADSQLCLALKDKSQSGAYISPMFDSGDPDCTFNRACLEIACNNLKYEFIIAVHNEPEVFIGGKAVNLQTYLLNPQISMEEKREVITALPHIRVANANDVLLHHLVGRYVCMYVGIHPAVDASLCITGMRFELPKHTFTDYFPEIYRDNDIFERFIAIFQSIYLDAESDIDHMPTRLDYENTGDEQLRYLAGWLGIEDKDGIFTAAQLRHIIHNIDVFQGGKGTKAALEEIIYLVCGIRPKIVEYFVWNKLQLPRQQREQMASLYGETSNHFCVILDVKNRTKPLPVERAVLEKLIQSYSMIGTEYKLVYLRQCSHIDTHCYLDINSCLSTPETANVGGVLLGSHITVG